MNVATAHKNAGNVQPSFDLPSDMLTGVSGDFTATAINYGSNPYATLGATLSTDDDNAARRRRLTKDSDVTTEGALQSNSSVTGLSIAGVAVSDLTSAIVITMALPRSSYTDGGDDDSINKTTTHMLNCTMNGTLSGGNTVTNEDLDRAEGCGFPGLSFTSQPLSYRVGPHYILFVTFHLPLASC